MSGHSKWATIKHKKAATDAKKGKFFSKHSKLITIAAKGGGDPIMNASLRLAIDNAKKDNMPNGNIEKAIKKGTGEDKESSVIEEVVYEGFGPAGTALMIECLTDNKNRTLTNIKIILNKKGGNMGSAGTVAWMFERKGVIAIKKQKNNDELELIAIEAEADDIEINEDHATIYTKMDEFMQVKSNLENTGLEIEKASLQYIAKEDIKISSKDDSEKIINLIEALEDDEDVSEVFSNFDIDESLL